MERIAVLYDRASYFKQANNWSRQDARTIGKMLADKYGFTLDERVEVASGEELVNRPVMRGILDDIKAGRVHAIIVQNWSRLSRDADDIDGKIIKKICRDYGCLIITPEMAYDLDKTTHDDMADMQLLGAKWHKRNMMTFVLQGMKGKARSGGYLGGTPRLGYDVVYTQQNGNKPTGDWQINEEEAEIVAKIFEIYASGVGANETARIINRMGYRKPRKKVAYQEAFGEDRLFGSKDIIDVIEFRGYTGVVSWGSGKRSRFLKDYEVESVYRPELQIVSSELWEQCNAIRHSRKRQSKVMGKWALFPFTGFLACHRCGGLLYGNSVMRPSGNRFTFYRCINHTVPDRKHLCPLGQSISHKIVKEAVIPFTVNLIKDKYVPALERAKQEDGRVGTEEDIVEASRIGLMQVIEEKGRVIKSVANGVFTEEEARKVMEELRARELRLENSLALVKQETQIKEQFERAVGFIRTQGAEDRLEAIIQNDPGTFRHIMSIIYEPGSIVVVSDRHKNTWTGEVVSYKLSPGFKAVMNELGQANLVGDA